MNWVSHRAVLPSAEGVAPTEAPALLIEVRLKHENKAPGFAHKYITKTTNAKYWGPRSGVSELTILSTPLADKSSPKEICLVIISARFQSKPGTEMIEFNNIPASSATEKVLST